ncbi:MAG TPA: hypothetical protein VHY20_15920 [Pirellulales bacterium]|nr:hypothetical protein [Pirellulales bacterium]
MKSVMLCAAALALVCQSAGCCRMCCWQHGGSWYNGQCYMAQPAAGAPCAPCSVPATTAPYTVQPQTTAPALVPQQTFVPVNPCTCN